MVSWSLEERTGGHEAIRHAVTCRGRVPVFLGFVAPMLKNSSSIEGQDIFVAPETRDVENIVAALLPSRHLVDPDRLAILLPYAPERRTETILNILLRRMTFCGSQKHHFLIDEQCAAR